MNMTNEEIMRYGGVDLDSDPGNNNRPVQEGTDPGDLDSTEEDEEPSETESSRDVLEESSFSDSDEDDELEDSNSINAEILSRLQQHPREDEEFCQLSVPTKGSRRRLKKSISEDVVVKNHGEVVREPDRLRDDGGGPNGNSPNGAARNGGGSRQQKPLYPPERPPPIVDFITIFTAFFVAIVAAYFTAT